MNLTNKKTTNLFNRILNIFFNIITLNKLPLKGSLIYFLLLLIGIISSLIIRYSHINIFILPFPEYINNSIRIFSILYTLFLFFNYLIITAHAFKLINFINFESKFHNLNKVNSISIFIGYYLYYFYITFVTSYLVIINYLSFLKININFINFINPNLYYYLFILFIIFIIACYFIINKVNFIYDINKQLSFTGKFILISLFSLFWVYLYSIYSGLIFKIFNIISPFKTIYCETSSTQAANELNNLNDNSTPLGTVINSNNENSTNLNQSNNNSNIGNTIVREPTDTNTNTNQHHTSTTNTRTVSLLVSEYSTNNNNSSTSNIRSSRTHTNKSFFNTYTSLDKTDGKNCYNNNDNEYKKLKWNYNNKSSDINNFNIRQSIWEHVWPKKASDFNNYNPNLETNYLTDSFYGNISNINKNNNTFLNNKTSDYIIKSIKTKSFSTTLNEINSFWIHKSINLDYTKKYLLLLFDAVLKQSTEHRLLFLYLMVHIDNLTEDSLIYSDIYKFLQIAFNGKLIYLNGYNSYFKGINKLNTHFCFDIEGTNEFTLINNLFDLLFSYNSQNLSGDQSIEKNIIDNLIKKHLHLFNKKYGFEFNINNYINEMDNILTNKNYTENKIDNLIFNDKLGTFLFKFEFNGETSDIIIPCNSLFKLRYYIFNKQTNLIDEFKKLCKIFNIKYNLFNDNQIIPQDILNLINKLDKNYVKLLDNKFFFLTNPPKIWEEEILNKLLLKYNINHVYSNDNNLLNEKHYDVLINRIIKNKLLEILKNQQLNINLQWEMKLKIPGLNITLFENNKDNLFSISESTTKKY